MVVKSLSSSISRSRRTNASRHKPSELLLFRWLLYELISARTGYGDFASYHRRFKYDNAVLECVCGLETSPTHLIRYRTRSTLVRQLRKGLTMNEYTSQLTGHKCLDKIKRFGRITSCFGGLPEHSSSTECGDSN